MSIFEAITLGAIQGLTEFLPISSTGHLILVQQLFGNGQSNGLAFDAILHLATATAVIVYFRKDIWLLMQALLRKLGRLPVNRRDEIMVYALIVATIPGVVLGLLLESFMETTFRSPLLVACILILGSFLFIYAEWMYINRPRLNEMNLTKGFKIGLFQALALLPGVSRSGATISGGMLLGLTREEAARFSFLMAIPIILGAGAKKVLELLVTHTDIGWTSAGIGAVVAFGTGLFAIHFMLSFVRSHTLWPFIWYRIILACFVLFILFLG